MHSVEGKNNVKFVKISYKNPTVTVHRIHTKHNKLYINEVFIDYYEVRVQDCLNHKSDGFPIRVVFTYLFGLLAG